MYLTKCMVIVFKTHAIIKIQVLSEIKDQLVFR